VRTPAHPLAPSRVGDFARHMCTATVCGVRCAACGNGLHLSAVPPFVFECLADVLQISSPRGLVFERSRARGLVIRQPNPRYLASGAGHWVTVGGNPNGTVGRGFFLVFFPVVGWMQAEVFMAAYVLEHGS
jgi:hypothetical protein